jgi:hypothetical protein
MYELLYTGWQGIVARTSRTLGEMVYMCIADHRPLQKQYKIPYALKRKLNIVLCYTKDVSIRLDWLLAGRKLYATPLSFIPNIIQYISAPEASQAEQMRCATNGTLGLYLTSWKYMNGWRKLGAPLGRARYLGE